jgi:hypothetical protein
LKKENKTLSQSITDKNHLLVQGSTKADIMKREIEKKDTFLEQLQEKLMTKEHELTDQHSQLTDFKEHQEKL